MTPSIRLTAKERKGMEESFASVLSPLGSFKVFLFGSRTDSEKKGGDIDLFISCETPLYKSPLTVSRRLKVDIYDRIGEQKIDIVWEKDGTKGEPFKEIIDSDMVLIWKTKN